MSAPPYMKLFWGSYHKNTRHLTKAAHHGAYMLLIGEAWQRCGSLPDDDAMLSAWAACTPEEWAAMKPTIMAFFALRRGKWVHDRVREELAVYESTSRKRKEAGKKGGSATRGKDSENPQAIATQLPTKSEPEPEPEIEGKTPVVPTGTTVVRIILRQADVEAVWEITPPKARSRTSRADIKTALQGAARRGAAPADIVAGLRAYYTLPEVAREDHAFAKGAHRIITKDRWKDYAGPTPIEAIAASVDPLEQHRQRVDRFKNGSRFWNTTDWGPQPGRPDCEVPAAILAEFGFTEPSAQLLPFSPNDRSVA